MSLRTRRPNLRLLHHLIAALCFSVLLHPAHAQQPSTPNTELPDTPTPQTIQPASITGTITDRDGAAIANAKITLSHPVLPSAEQQAISGPNGTFSFTNVTPGSFQLTIAAPGFATQQTSGSLQPGQQDEFPPISLLASANIGVNVTATQYDIAQAQIKIEETQRVFGIIPNFYVSYDPNPVPLAPKQKYDLAWKTSIDPVTFILTGAIAGIEQAQNTFPAYGQGAQGYAKYYGAAYADNFIATMLSNAVFPSLLKQDPRYFYKGTGSISSRALYAIANAVICKGDNGHWQPDYSGILGSLAAGGISNLYYPPADRGVALTFENTLLGIAGGAGANLFEEFLLRKLTPHLHAPAPPHP